MAKKVKKKFCSETDKAHRLLVDWFKYVGDARVLGVVGVHASSGM